MDNENDHRKIDIYPNYSNLLRRIDMVKDDMIESVTEEYLKDVDPSKEYDIIKIKADLTYLIHSYIELHNKAGDMQKWSEQDTLYPMQISMIIKKLYHVRRINMGGEETGIDAGYTLLAVYQDEGENEGIYTSDEDTLRAIIGEYNRDIEECELTQVINQLESMSEIVTRCDDPDLIAVQNGIFDYKKKILMPFSPEYVFTAKCRIPYIADPPNPVIFNDDGTTWDVESWMNELFEDDPDVVTTLWQVIGATIRPNVAWNKAAWLLSTQGNNGKGTLCELIRNLIGRGSYASLKLTDFAKDFMLEPLIHCTAIITDENDVGTYVDQAANLKAIITGDTILIDRKFLPAISYQFRGFMIQCVNDMPRIRDRSESFYRRQLIIGFKKSYTGIERKEIKEKHIKRQDVLEYVLHKVLNMDYYEIDEPDSCKEQMRSYKLNNDSVREFLHDIIEEITVDALPDKYLYALYIKWIERNNPGTKKCLISKANFVNEIKELIEDYPEWIYPESSFLAGRLLAGGERTVKLYDMRDWMTDEKSTDPEVKYHLKWGGISMRGLLRREAQNDPKTTAKGGSADSDDA